MLRMVNKVSDRMLGVFAPKIEAAAACVPRRVGCCDIGICLFRCATRPDWCAGCSGPDCK